jgi:hypothetical protein
MKTRILAFFIIIASNSFAQSFNEDKTAFTNFLKRMYTATPFEGVKVIDDVDHQYFFSVLSLEKAKYTNPSMMNRVAQVKAQSQANTFFNGSNINMDLVVRTTEKTEGGKTSMVTESLESIRENASGFTQGLELLTNFENADNTRMVFMFYREIKN